MFKSMMFFTMLFIGMHGIRHRVSHKYLNWKAYNLKKHDRAIKALDELKMMGIGPS